VSRPIEVIEGLGVTEQSLVASLHGLTDETARQPSLLPNWSVGHVLTHLARNADSVVRRLEAAVRGEIVDQYPGGFAGRSAEIEMGASRSARDLVTDVALSGSRVIDACATLDDEAWDALSRDVSGLLRPSRDVLFSRWREVEVHRCDLGLGYTSAHWPPLMVATWLPSEMAVLPERTDPSALLAWIIGRGEAPPLSQWGK
jgi:maleylpyruvate isomerase